MGSEEDDTQESVETKGFGSIQIIKPCFLFPLFYLKTIL